MIRITSAQQARSLKERIPPIVVTRMEQFEGSDHLYAPEIYGYLIWMEAGDKCTDVTDVSPTGLHELMDEECPGFEHVESHPHKDRIIYEIVVLIDNTKTIAIFIEDGDWIEEHIRTVLREESKAYAAYAS